MDLCSVNVDKLKALRFRKMKYEVWFVEEKFKGNKHIRHYSGKINEDRWVDISLTSNVNDYESRDSDLNQIQEEMLEKYG